MSELTDRRKRPEKPARPSRKKQYVSPDGAKRSPKAEHNINEAFAIVFRGPAAERVIAYLKSVSTNKVCGPGTHPDTINYFEGARWLMGIIDTRIKHGEEKKP